MDLSTLDPRPSADAPKGIKLEVEYNVLYSMLHIMYGYDLNCSTKLEKPSGVLLHSATSTVQWIEPVYGHTISEDSTSLSHFP